MMWAFQTTAGAGMDGLSKEALTQVAAYFQALAEPTRLQILNLLREKERNVGELAELCGFSSANISRHLSYLSQQGFVLRESRGNSAYYRIADPAIYALCDLVCGNIARLMARTAQGRAAFVVPASEP
jgi:DNA-binding transcriptional ArsR family regulator